MPETKPLPTVSDPIDRGRRRPPSGQQIELSFENQIVTVVEVGGALRTYAIGERPLLDGYGPDERSTGARGQTMIPWPNRLRDGTYRCRGTDYQLPLSEPEKHNAIHGLARWAGWSIAERDHERVVLTHTIHPQAGWPFLLDLSIEYRLGPNGLSVGTTATNEGGEPAPYGTGAHPYLSLGTPTIDELLLEAPGTRWTPLDAQGIPTGSKPVEGTEYDFRMARPIGTTQLDSGYVDLIRDADGLAHVKLTNVATNDSVRLWMDDAYQFLMLFTGDSLSITERRRRGLGVEPMTCAPNALQSGDGIRTLEPGESFTSTWGISPCAQPPTKDGNDG